MLLQRCILVRDMINIRKALKKKNPELFGIFLPTWGGRSSQFPKTRNKISALKLPWNHPKNIPKFPQNCPFFEGGVPQRGGGSVHHLGKIPEKSHIFLFSATLIIVVRLPKRIMPIDWVLWVGRVQGRCKEGWISCQDNHLKGILTVWDLCIVILWPIKQLRDLRGKLGLFWDHIWTLVPIGTNSRNRDLFGTTANAGWPVGFLILSTTI